MAHLAIVELVGCRVSSSSYDFSLTKNTLLWQLWAWLEKRGISPLRLLLQEEAVQLGGDGTVRLAGGLLVSVQVASQRELPPTPIAVESFLSWKYCCCFARTNPANSTRICYFLISGLTARVRIHHTRRAETFPSATGARCHNLSITYPQRIEGARPRQRPPLVPGGYGIELTGVCQDMCP